MNTQQEAADREAFCAAYIDRLGLRMEDYDFEYDEATERYCDEDVQSAWWGWQTARATLSQQGGGAVAEPVAGAAHIWREGFSAGHKWSQEVDSYYEAGNFGNQPKEPANPYPTSVGVIAEKAQKLYLAAANLLVYLGREGSIHSDGSAAQTLMDCLNDLDGGEYNENLFATLAPLDVETSAAHRINFYCPHLTTEQAGDLTERICADLAERKANVLVGILGSAAPPAPQEARKPLTDDKLFSLLKEHFGLDQRRDDTVIDRSSGRFTDAQRYRNFARAVIAATAKGERG